MKRKPTMLKMTVLKPTMTMLVCALAAGLASAQSPSIIQNTRQTMNGVRDNEAAASNAALSASQSAAPASAAQAVPASSGAESISVKPSKHSAGKSAHMHHPRRAQNPDCAERQWPSPAD